MEYSSGESSRSAFVCGIAVGEYIDYRRMRTGSTYGVCNFLSSLILRFFLYAIRGDDFQLTNIFKNRPWDDPEFQQNSLFFHFKRYFFYNSSETSSSLKIEFFRHSFSF